VIVAQKIVSKAEGAIVDLREIRPFEFASQWARRWGKDAMSIVFAAIGQYANRAPA
jgi:F420-0:gamma-glutamyl ligase